MRICSCYCVVNEVTEESVRCHFEKPKCEQDRPSSSSALPRHPRKPKNTHHFWIMCHQSPWWPQSHLEHNVRHRTSTQTDTLACWNICTHNNSLFVSKLDFLLIIFSCVNSGKTLGGQAPAYFSHYQQCLQVCVCVCVCLRACVCVAYYNLDNCMWLHSCNTQWKSLTQLSSLPAAAPPGPNTYAQAD